MIQFEIKYHKPQKFCPLLVPLVKYYRISLLVEVTPIIWKKTGLGLLGSLALKHQF